MKGKKCDKCGHEYAAQIDELEAEVKRLKAELEKYRQKEIWQPNIETITDEWGNTRTIVHEMGQ